MQRPIRGLRGPLANLSSESSTPSPLSTNFSHHFPPPPIHQKNGTTMLRKEIVKSSSCFCNHPLRLSSSHADYHCSLPISPSLSHRIYSVPHLESLPAFGFWGNSLLFPLHFSLVRFISPSRSPNAGMSRSLAWVCFCHPLSLLLGHIQSHSFK